MSRPEPDSRVLRRIRRCLPLLLAALAPAAHAQGLGQLIGMALASHPSAQSQRALVDSAQAGVGGARWQFFPTPSVSIETARTSSTDRLYQGEDRVSILRLQQPLWTGGRLTAGLEKAEANLTASESSLEEVRQQLAVRVVQAYGDWLAAHLRVLAGEKSLAVHLRLRDQVGRRISEGAAAESDRTLAVARLESISADVTAGATQRDIALARLGQLLGRRVEGASLGATPAAPRPLGGGVQELLDQALSANPVVQKARAQSRVQASVIDERRADLSPEVFVRVERQIGNFTFSDGPPENRLFFGLNTRFGAGLSNLTSIEAARLQHQSALAEVDAQARAVSEQVLADYAVVATADSRMQALRASLEATKEVALSYDRQYLAGRKSWLDVMNTARELAQTEAQLADLQSTHVVASWRLAIVTRGVADVTGGAP
jgi:adhesin transport system outer membrane protein